MMLRLRGFARSDVMGVFGKLVLPDGWECYTVELPWRNNAQSESCIPDGTYELHKRWSGVVRRSSEGEFKRGWHVRHVFARKYIMIHPGNTLLDLDGCIALGSDMGYVEGHWAVTRSRDTFREFMERMNKLAAEKPSKERIGLEVSRHIIV